VTALPLTANVTESDLNILHVLGPHWKIFILIEHDFSLKVFLSTFCMNGVRKELLMPLHEQRF